MRDIVGILFVIGTGDATIEPRNSLLQEDEYRNINFILFVKYGIIKTIDMENYN